MILDISSFLTNEGKQESEKVSIEMTSFKSKMGCFPILKSEPFQLQISNVENKQLFIQGEMNVTIAIPCDRCLTEVPVVLPVVIDKKLSLSDGKLLTENAEDRLEQSAYLHGYQLDIDQLVYGEILVSWPAKVLCKDDCKGICKKCGVNLNEQSCNCDQTVPDPRMAAFQDVFNKFKEV